MPNEPLRIDRPAQPVAVAPGGEVVLRGSFVSTNDGSIVDAATTTWPADAPAGATIDAGGLVDFEAGGFHLTSRDPLSHEVHAVATGNPGAACSALGIASPCLPLRLLPQARSRLLSVADWSRSLQGAISVETVAPPPYAAATRTAAEYASAAAWVAGAIVCLGTALLFARLRARRRTSPHGRLRTLARQIREKAKRADPVVAAPLVPVLDSLAKSVEDRTIDAQSKEGERVLAALLRVDARLEDAASRARIAEEKQAADALVEEMENAIEAAEEASRIDAPTRRGE